MDEYEAQAREVMRKLYDDRRLATDEVIIEHIAAALRRQDEEIRKLREALTLVAPFLSDAPRCDYNEDRTIMWLIHAREAVRAALSGKESDREKE